MCPKVRINYYLIYFCNLRYFKSIGDLEPFLFLLRGIKSNIATFQIRTYSLLIIFTFNWTLLIYNLK
jgi:hypothetical protein